MKGKINPYTLVFGKTPSQFISRYSQAVEVIEQFNSPSPSQQVYMITGVRGSGKTVFMTDTAKAITAEKNWINIELNPEKDLLEGLIAKLSSEESVSKLITSARINLSFFGLGLSIEGTTPVRDIETALTRVFEALKKHGKRVLISIDEVTNTKDIQVFASAFQIFVRQDLPVFLLMTGLYENIYELQNEKSLTFLYRAPKIDLRPLNINRIAANYENTLAIDPDLALKLAKLTKGYSFAFQVLGYFAWKNSTDINSLINDYRQYLEDFVYEKIWNELSANDKRLAYGIANTPGGKIIDIRETLGIDTNSFNPYRRRLMRKGLVEGEHGYLHFTLPLFEDYVNSVYESNISPAP